MTIKGYFTESSFLQQHKVLQSITSLPQEILCWAKSHPRENGTLCSNTRSYFINEAVLWQQRKLQSQCRSPLKEHVMNLRLGLRSSADPGKQPVRSNWDLCGFRASSSDLVILLWNISSAGWACWFNLLVRWSNGSCGGQSISSGNEMPSGAREHTQPGRGSTNTCTVQQESSE